MTSTSTEPTVTQGSGNVFADLGLPDADELLAKARLASAISDIIAGRHLSQAAAAQLLGTTQPNISNLANGRLEGFSLERLTRFLNALGRDVEIVVKRRPSSRKVSRLRVTMG
jgi:predicted XRE-type DNA-binding protein